MSDFKIIRPVTVTTAMLTSSTVVETTPAAWNSGTTYADGDLVYTGTIGGVLTVWESLQNSNTNHAPASSPTWWVERNDVYAEYAGGTTYAAGDYVQVAATHLVYRSLVAGNVGNAVTDTTKWQQIGATNKWLPFDGIVNSQATAKNSLQYVITPGVIVNSLVLLNCQGTSVTVDQSVSGYSRTITIQRHPVNNWYDFWYEPLVEVGDIVFDDIPPYPASSLTVTITGVDCGVGVLVIGKSRTLGTTQWGATGGAIDYSGITTDEFGNVDIVQRSNAKKLNLDVFIEETFADEAHRLLSLYTGAKLVFVGANDRSMTIAYGFLKNWAVVAGINGETSPIEIQGLV